MDTYEKKYKEALERAKVIYQGSYKPDTAATIAETLQNVFPELRESEDERIRKEIIETFKNLGDGKIPVDINYADIFTWLEKQGEQKPVDKVEPKFKVEEGKWYVCTQTFVLRGKIVIIKGQTYQAEKDNVIKGEDGCLFIDRHDGKASDYFRLWTIQDAKDGDVLVTNNGLAFIYNEYLEEQQWPFAYGGINLYGRFNICNGLLPFTHQKVVPASKEQRNLLFKKMKEAGYEFDFEKKELKKISQRMLSAEAKEALYDKSVWNEEDKEMISRIRSIVEKYAFSQSAVDVNGDLCEKEYIDVDNWLKTLKDRAQSKQEWGEEDEIKMHATLAFIKSEFPKKGNEEIMEDTIEWLKSLKQRIGGKV